MNLGDEPDLYKKARDRNSLYLNNKGEHLTAATIPTVTGACPITSVAYSNSVIGKVKRTLSPEASENGYVPTVGRWGVEWPS